MFQIFNDPTSTRMPDTAIEEFENRIIAEGDSIRPGFSTHGEPMILNANCLSLTFDNCSIFCYRWRLSQVLGGGCKSPVGGKARRIFRQFLLEELPTYWPFIATDYESQLFSCVRLPLAAQYHVKFPSSSQREDDPQKDTYLLTCNECRDIRPSCILSSTARPDPETTLGLSSSVKTILSAHFRQQNSVISSHPDRGMIVRATANDQFVLGRGFELVYHISFEPKFFYGHALVQFNVKSSVVYRPGPLQALFQQYQETEDCDLYSLEMLLKGLLVNLVPFQRRGTITGLATMISNSAGLNPPRINHFGAGPDDVKIHVAGRRYAEKANYVTITRLFKDGRLPLRHTIFKVVKLTDVVIGCDLDPKFPLLNVGSVDKPVYWPIELCHVEPGQFTRRIAKPKILSTGTRSVIEKALEALALTELPDSTLACFGMKLIPNPITVWGQILPPPNLLYRQATIRPSGGLWAVQPTSKVARSAGRRRWAWIWIDAPRPIGDPASRNVKWMRQLAVVFRQMEVLKKAPVMGVCLTLGARNPQQKIDKVLRAMKTKYGLSLVVIVLPDSYKELMGSIHHIGDVRYGIHTITIPSEKLESPDQRFLPGIALTANLKLGGQNHSVQTSSRLRFLSNEKCMLVGIATSDLVQQNSKSAARFGVVVTSIDRAFSQWPFDFCLQNSDQQTISGLKDLISSRVKFWASQNSGEFPEDIVIYRDKIPPRHFDSVAREELWLIRRGCHSVYPRSSKYRGLPRVTMVLVDQLSQMSFTPIVDVDADGTGFSAAGTIVDRGVTDPRAWDFYLLSHCPDISKNQATHYFVVCDEVFQMRQNRAARVLQEFTNNLSYLAGDRTTAVNVCAPAYYARVALSRLSGYSNQHWLSESGLSQAGLSTVATEPDYRTHQSLENTMFYI